MNHRYTWINAAINTPCLTESMPGGYKRSKDVPVIISGVKGWFKGYIIASDDEQYSEWKVEGFNVLDGDRVVTFWLDIQLPYLEVLLNADKR